MFIYTCAFYKSFGWKNWKKKKTNWEIYKIIKCMCLCTSTYCVCVSINDKLKMNKFITQQRLDSKRIGSRTNFTVEKRVELKINRKMKRAVNGFGCVMRPLGGVDDSFFIRSSEVHSSLLSFFQLF